MQFHLPTRLSPAVNAITLSTLLIAAAPFALAQPTKPTPTPAAASAVAPAAPAPAATPAAAAAGDATEGKVAYYGSKFNGRRTASGQRFDSNALTMAHRSLPFGTQVRVTNVKNKKSVVVRVNDRGPTTPDRIGDLTTAAAKRIGMTRAGVADVKLEVVGKQAARKFKAGKG